MKKLTHYKHTLRACYISYMSHAVVNNFISLLSVMFYTQYGISLQKLGLLATINFVVQLCMDLLIANIGDRVGYRPLVIISHLLMGVGHHRSIDQPDRGSLSHRSEKWQYESAAFILLLGTCAHGPDLDRFLRAVRYR